MLCFLTLRPVSRYPTKQHNTTTPILVTPFVYRTHLWLWLRSRFGIRLLGRRASVRHSVLRSRRISTTGVGCCRKESFLRRLIGGHQSGHDGGDAGITRTSALKVKKGVAGRETFRSDLKFFGSTSAHKANRVQVTYHVSYIRTSIF